MLRVSGTGPTAGRAGRRAVVELGRSVSALAWVAVMAVCYGQLIPFRFVGGGQGGGGVVGALAALPWAASTPEDVLTNFVIFIPVGLLMTLHFGRGSRRWRAALAGGLLFVGGLGACLEMLQAYMPLRVASATDVLNNCLGGLAGALSAPVVYGRWRRARRRVGLYMAACPHYLLYGGLAVVVALAALAPFDVSFSWTRLREAAAAAQWWPLDGGREELIAAAGGEANRVLLSCLRQLGVFGALAFLAVRALRELGCGPAVAALVALRRTVVLAVGLECLQVLTASHTFELLDIFAAWSGAVMGVWLVFLVDGTDWRPDGWCRPSSKNRLPVLLGLAACLAYQGVAALLPAAEIGPAPSGGAFAWLPFLGEFHRPVAAAVTGLAGRLVTFSVSAMLLLWAWGGVRRSAAVWLAVLTMLLWAGMLEAARCGLLGRAADTSGPVLAAAAAMLAVLALTWAEGLSGDARRELLRAAVRAKPAPAG